MRKEQFYRSTDAEAIAVLVRAGIMRLATTTPEGEPVLRTLHGVWVRGAVAFHGATVGEKSLAVGRRAVISADETVASIPSWFLDPERACPATTLYRSVQVHGVIETVADGVEKSEVLEALMGRFQPEGRYEPIDPADERYRTAVRSIGVYRVVPDRLDGKMKLTQNRTPDERARVVEQLWLRGDPGDDAAIEAIRDANTNVRVPAVFEGAPGFTLHARLGERDLDAAAALLSTADWCAGQSVDELRFLLSNATAWVGARDASGTLVATARAVSDRRKYAWIYDVMVAPGLRGKGLGRAMMTLLLDHPALRRVRTVSLHTRTAEKLYASMGFRTVAKDAAINRATMVRSRA